MVKLPEFGPYLSARRRERNWSLRQMGHRAKVSAPTILRLERGDSHPTVEVADKLARALGESTLVFLTAYLTPREYRGWVKKEESNG